MKLDSWLKRKMSENKRKTKKDGAQMKPYYVTIVKLASFEN